jgi:hypothetical protein
MQPGTDPVSQAIARSALMAGTRPVPLLSTSYDINIRGGLADVAAVRTFRNDEAHSIEATLTFPVPVHAVVYSLQACIAGRTLRAVARAKTVARQTYEEAIDKGKSTILHEELLRGVHLLSVGHIAPGTEIVVTLRFAVALARLGERILLHIPTTVGDIYGQSGLPDSDELCHRQAEHIAELKVATDAGEVVLLGGQLTDGKARIQLNAPIHIEVKSWLARALRARAADGRSITLTIEQAPAGDRLLNTAILLDHSASMRELCAGDGGLTKHAAALLGLSEAAVDIREGDQLHLWEFNDQVRNLGSIAGKQWRTHLRRLSEPSGGTEIGPALDAVLASAARDIILVTDGKSHALDVAKLARSGARFTLVLIGEDSLEANVGHLAALTGGEIFVPDGAEVADAVRSAVRAMRQPAGDPQEAHLRRSGMIMRASWKPDLPSTASARADDNRAAAAYAASLLLASLDEKEAAILAENEGLVTHLTSLVLVDEAGANQTGLPAMRKVALPTPRTSVLHALSMSVPRSYSAKGAVSRARLYSTDTGAVSPTCPVEEQDAAPRKNIEPAPTPKIRNELHLATIAANIRWSKLGDDAFTGNLARLDRAKRDKIDTAAGLPLVRKVSTELGITPVALVFGLMARFMAGRDRYAARLARALIGGVNSRVLVRVAELLELVEPTA